MYVSISKREDVSKFSCIFKHIGNLQELFKLVFTPEGITGQAMDSAHVCLFELKLEKNWFDEYKVDTRNRNRYCCSIILQDDRMFKRESNNYFAYG